MRGASKNQIVRGLIPWAATVLSMSLAVTLRVEHACSGGVPPAPTIASCVDYPYFELMTFNTLE
jgi:hypothetical protein